MSIGEFELNGDEGLGVEVVERATPSEGEMEGKRHNGMGTHRHDAVKSSMIPSPSNPTAPIRPQRAARSGTSEAVSENWVRRGQNSGARSSIPVPMEVAELGGRKRVRWGFGGEREVLQSPRKVKLPEERRLAASTRSETHVDDESKDTTPSMYSHATTSSIHLPLLNALPGSFVSSPTKIMALENHVSPPVRTSLSERMPYGIGVGNMALDSPPMVRRVDGPLQSYGTLDATPAKATVHFSGSTKTSPRRMIGTPLKTRRSMEVDMDDLKQTYRKAIGSAARHEKEEHVDAARVPRAQKGDVKEKNIPVKLPSQQAAEKKGMKTPTSVPNGNRLPRKGTETTTKKPTIPVQTPSPRAKNSFHPMHENSHSGHRSIPQSQRKSVFDVLAPWTPVPVKTSSVFERLYTPSKTPSTLTSRKPMHMSTPSTLSGRDAVRSTAPSTAAKTSSTLYSKQAVRPPATPKPPAATIKQTPRKPPTQNEKPKTADAQAISRFVRRLREEDEHGEKVSSLRLEAASNGPQIRSNGLFTPARRTPMRGKPGQKLSSQTVDKGAAILPSKQVVDELDRSIDEYKKSLREL